MTVYDMHDIYGGVMGVRRLEAVQNCRQQLCIYDS